MAKRAKAKGRNGKLHLHIENTTELDEVFRATPERVKAALKRHPGLERRLRITFSEDGSGFEEQLATADAIFAWNFDRRDLARRAPRLRWVQAHAAGVGHLMPLDWLPKGAVLTNSSGVHGPRADEYAIMAVLMLNNRVPEMVTSQREGVWRQVFNTGIAGKTLLVVGVGSVGGGVARWAKKFGLKVLGIRRTGKPAAGVDRMYKQKDLDRLLPTVDFVIVTAPHTLATRGMIGRKQIGLLKPGAGLVNYSRAALVDYEALRERLERREISAVLDVFNPEPLPSSSPLWKTPNLVITPHCSSDDLDAYTPRTLDLVFRNVKRLIAGKKLENIVDPVHEY
jgi:phosphoglycerate dehydrogenase-like enzyme